MSKVNATFSAIDCETYFSEGGCGADFVLNILLGGGASDIANASSDNETGELRLQNSRLCAVPGRSLAISANLLCLYGSAT